MPHRYFVYILTTKKKTVLYVGVTNDLAHRMFQHQNSLIPGFTARYNCHYLVYFEEFKYIDKAIEREKEIKAWRRSKKEALINSKNPDWEFLDAERDPSLRSG